MIYTPMTKKAIKLIYNLHKDQVDKSGIPYVFHPFHVAETMDDEKSTIVALLHDILEDTQITKKDLLDLGFDSDIIYSLDLLTHKENETYSEYINKIALDDIARKVKKADLQHNMCLDRLDTITEEDLIRVEKYKKSYSYLDNYELLMNENYKNVR